MFEHIPGADVGSLDTGAGLMAEMSMQPLLRSAPPQHQMQAHLPQMHRDQQQPAPALDFSLFENLDKLDFTAMLAAIEPGSNVQLAGIPGV